MEKKQKTIIVKDNSPVCCPTKEHETWNQHPRVYIDIKGKKSATCPYCGTIFKIEK